MQDQMPTFFGKDPSHTGPAAIIISIIQKKRRRKQFFLNQILNIYK